MKTEKNIRNAFLLNLCFSIFEFIGGALTGSIAIISDAVHDLGDAASIGFSYFLERKSKKQPDESYTYGYVRYSVIGSVITTLILLFGSVMVMYNAVLRMLNPVEIHYDGMILLAIMGVIVNFAAAWFTREGDSLNQKAVNLHMMEDVLGWAVVLIGAIFMRFTDMRIIDPLLSIAVALYILCHAIQNLKTALDLFLEKTPKGIELSHMKEHLLAIEGVEDVHHIHIWSIDGIHNYATMHIVSETEPFQVKQAVRETLQKHGIGHVTLELENSDEDCAAQHCQVDFACKGHHHHHHGHGHHHHAH